MCEWLSNTQSQQSCPPLFVYERLLSIPRVTILTPFGDELAQGYQQHLFCTNTSGSYFCEAVHIFVKDIFWLQIGVCFHISDRALHTIESTEKY